MQQYVTIMTRKGQITVPAEVRRALGLKQGDRIAVLIEGTEVRLALARSVVDRTAGAVQSAQPPLTAKEQREVVEEAWAAEALERGGVRS